MSSPEITTTNQVRWRVAIADRRWREALELVRQASAAPGYSGPAIEDLERVAAAIAEIRDQVKDWSLEENLQPHKPPAPRLAGSEPFRPEGDRRARRPLVQARSRPTITSLIN